MARRLLHADFADFGVRRFTAAFLRCLLRLVYPAQFDLYSASLYRRFSSLPVATSESKYAEWRAKPKRCVAEEARL
jgi:hypothetical protein